MSVLLLAGGVGGAKMARGLMNAADPAQLKIVVNTGDDFEHVGLFISPDIDSVTYALAGMNDPVRGWGMRGETWQFMDAMKRLGGETWFLLGDRDLATHVERTFRLRTRSLSAVTADLAASLGIRCAVAPMSDDPVRTTIVADDGTILPFQRYFVEQRCAPVVRDIVFSGVEQARPARLLVETLADPALEAVVFAPSNPFVSIAPILAIPGVREALAAVRAPRIAVSPFVGGEALKGPAAKIARERGVAPNAAGLAALYGGIVDAIVCDDPFPGPVPDGLHIHVCDTVMKAEPAEARVGRIVLDLAETLGARG